MASAFYLCYGSILNLLNRRYIEKWAKMKKPVDQWRWLGKLYNCRDALGQGRKRVRLKNNQSPLGNVSQV